MAFKLLKKTLVGAAAQQLTATNTRCAQAIIQAARNNAALVTVGDSTVAANGGIELVKPLANAQIEVVPLKAAGVGNNIDLSHIYVIDSAISRHLVWYKRIFSSMLWQSTVHERGLMSNVGHNRRKV